MAKESGDPACAAESAGNVTAVDAAIAKHTLTPELLTVEAFSPYGEVLVAGNACEIAYVDIASLIVRWMTFCHCCSI